MAMKKLKQIMRINNIDEREKELVQHAQKIGVSISGLASSTTGMLDENLLIERIEQRYTILLVRRTWILALFACIGSAVSALAAWIAVLK